LVEQTLINLQKDLDNYGIIMSFSGVFSQGIIVEIGEAMKNYLKSQKDVSSKRLSVFSVFIEQTQNIKNYLYEKSKINYDKELIESGIIVVGKNDDLFFVYSGNLIENSDEKNLIEKIEFLNKLDKNELKKLYKEQVRKERPEGINNAGLGLIEMARKTSNQIEYHVSKKNEKYSYFTLKVTL